MTKLGAYFLSSNFPKCCATSKVARLVHFALGPRFVEIILSQAVPSISIIWVRLLLVPCTVIRYPSASFVFQTLCLRI